MRTWSGVASSAPGQWAIAWVRRTAAHGVRLLGAIIATFLALNVALCLLDYPSIDSHPAPHVKKLRYPEQANVFRDEGYSRFRINRFGLIDAEPGPITAGSIFRIAVFGDSMVEALQVPIEARFSSLIGRGLPRPDGFSAAEAWNFGYSGDNTGNAFARWVYQRADIQFQQVLFTFSDQDLTENRPEDVRGPSGAFLVRDTAGRYVLDESRVDPNVNVPLWEIKRFFGRFFLSIYNFKLRLNDVLAAKRERFKAWGSAWAARPVAASSESAGGEVPRGAIDDTCAQLRYVRDSIRAQGPEVVLLGLPSAHVVLDDDNHRDRRRHDAYVALVRCLREAGAPVVDPLPQLAQSMSAGVDPFRDWNEKGGHYNRIGHRIIADTVLAYMGTASQFSYSSARR
jgi:hypothetical protein